MSVPTFMFFALGALVQYYDYYLYSFFVVQISKTFFPSGDAAKQISNAYALLSISYLLKPCAAVVFGRIGDLYGRQAPLIISLIGVALSSLVIGVLPSYNSIGMIAPIVLLASRIIISLLVSCGTDGVRIYIFENTPPHYKCFGIGITWCFTMFGSLLASFAAWFFMLDFFEEGAWRYAFILGSFMGITLMIMKYVYSSSIDLRNYVKDDKKYDQYSRSSIYSIVAQHSKLFIISAILCGCLGSVNKFNNIFFGIYAGSVIKMMDPVKMSLYSSIAVFLYSIFSPIAGYCSDIFGYKNASKFGFIVVLITTVINIIYLKYYMCVCISAYLIGTAALTFVTMSGIYHLTNNMPLAIRYRVHSLSHAIGSSLLSGTTGFFATNIYRYSEVSWLPLMYFILCVVVIFILTQRDF